MANRGGGDTVGAVRMALLPGSAPEGRAARVPLGGRGRYLMRFAVGAHDTALLDRIERPATGTGGQTGS